MTEPPHAPTLPQQGGAQQQGHTEEPWEVDVANAEDECWAVAAAVDPKGASLIAICASGADKPNQANARRIVACVNACKGWTTEGLEQFASGDFDQAPLARELAERIRRADETAALLAEAQRTEGALRSALHRCALLAANRDDKNYEHRDLLSEIDEVAMDVLWPPKPKQPSP